LRLSSGSRRGITTAAGTLLLSGCLGLVSAGAGAEASSDSGQAPSCVATAGVSHTERVGPNDPEGRPDGATIQYYDIQGSEGESHVPPAGWKPANATNEELEFYGIPARPTDPATLQVWNNEWVNHYTAVEAPSSLCATEVRHDTEAVQNNSTSTNWGGLVGHAGNYAYVYGQLNGTHGYSTCTPNDYHSAWVGLGGANTKSLVQNGMGSDGVPNQDYIWYELLDAAHPNAEVQVTFTISGGDTLGVSTTYATDSLGPYVRFGWHDFTNGNATNYTVRNSYAGDPIQNYIDETTAEAIDERPTVNGSLPKLRDYGTDNWQYVSGYSYGNYLTGSSHLPQYINMVNSGGTQLEHAAYVSPGAFNDVHDACGP